MEEEIDIEKCNFRNFSSSMTLTLTLDRVEVILVRILRRGLPTPHAKLDQNRKNFLWTYGRKDAPSSNLLGHLLGMT